MKKAIIFDFDGVILESTQVKIDAFRKMFSQYVDLVDEIVAYHIDKGGISRFIKFRHIYSNLLKQPLSKDKEIALGEEFTRLSLDGVLSVPYVAGAKEFLESNRSRYQFFIASGTPNDELSIVIEQRQMQKYFDGVYGSPQTKPDIIRMILDENNLKKDEVIFIGDANSDRLASRETKVDFIFRRHDGEPLTDDQWVLNDLRNLETLISEIEKKRSLAS